MIELLNGGLLNLSFRGLLAVTFVFVQISMMGVTLYLHRDQAHRAIDLHPVLRHFFRLWIWLTSGMVTRDWVAIHRKHHALVEREGDPHSPKVFGLRKVLTEGAELYRSEAKIGATLEKYGRGTPDDWVEKNIYSRFSVFGIYLVLVVDVILFGAIGLTLFAIQMLTMPVFAAGVINGLGHAKGYRNFETDDTSTNLTPIAVFIGGEELHNNHHAFPTSARFSARWYEFDAGWMYIRILAALGLCKVRRLAPQPAVADSPRAVDIQTLTAVLQNRMHVLRNYTRKVTLPVFRREKRVNRGNETLRRARKLLVSGPILLDEAAKARLARLLEDNVALRTVHEYRQQLLELWGQANVSNERLIRQLKEWCNRAESSGIDALHDFSANLRGYLPQAAMVA
ncbi:MAG: acyl-CoA desaturase [Gammaproteobacteria bacterium]|nr:MAG: acyl-CoA desaturase [Gammaproteobacteria bacterium]